MLESSSFMPRLNDRKVSFSTLIMLLTDTLKFWDFRYNVILLCIDLSSLRLEISFIFVLLDNIRKEEALEEFEEDELNCSLYRFEAVLAMELAGTISLAILYVVSDRRRVAKGASITRATSQKTITDLLWRSENFPILLNVSSNTKGDYN